MVEAFAQCNRPLLVRAYERSRRVVVVLDSLPRFVRLVFARIGLLTLSGERLTTTAIAGAVLVIGSCIAVGLERSEAQDYV